MLDLAPREALLLARQGQLMLMMLTWRPLLQATRCELRLVMLDLSPREALLLARQRQRLLRLTKSELRLVMLDLGGARGVAAAPSRAADAHDAGVAAASTIDEIRAEARDARLGPARQGS